MLSSHPLHPSPYTLRLNLIMLSQAEKEETHAAVVKELEQVAHNWIRIAREELQIAKVKAEALLQAATAERDRLQKENVRLRLERSILIAALERGQNGVDFQELLDFTKNVKVTIESRL
ncbi:unnamed protein product [Somion occarium]|uniref:Uncharacterized protein n=1 Tax=Somion occarium TaxID=3059160 RepID=A0ABP1D497_9APHY